MTVIFMGILNVTPDSFSDGGRFSSVDSAVQHALELVRSGAVIIDIGGESTRPYFTPITADIELQRVLPVIGKLADSLTDSNFTISIDTRKPDVAAEAILAGATFVNDISGGCDAMYEIVRLSGVQYCLTHSENIENDTIGEIYYFLETRATELIEYGILPSQIVIDPGIGFGKTCEQNWELVENIEKFLPLGFPILVGHSRKRFLLSRYSNRQVGTEEVTKILIDKGVDIIRLHEITNV